MTDFFRLPGDVRIVVFGTPRPAGSKRAFVVGGKARVVDANPNSRPWKQEITGAAMAQCGGGAMPFPTGPLSLHVKIVLKRPKSHYDSKGVLKPKARIWHESRPDTLKLVRAIEDALSGVVYRDDAQIANQLAFKVYGETERVEITVGRL